MPASWGRRPPLRALHFVQATTMLVQESAPPRDLGTTWSRDSSCVDCFFPQYWQRFPSRAKMLRRLNFTLAVGIRSQLINRITRGARISIERSDPVERVAAEPVLEAAGPIHDSKS